MREGLGRCRPQVVEQQALHVETEWGTETGIRLRGTLFVSYVITTNKLKHVCACFV